MTTSCCANNDNSKYGLAGALLLAAGALAWLVAPGPVQAAPDQDVPFALEAGSEGPVLQDPLDGVSDVSLLWRPGGGIDFKGEFRAAVPASPLFGQGVCDGAGFSFGCETAWSPLIPYDRPSWRGASVGSEWQPLNGLRLGMDYYSHQATAPHTGALLLPRVLDFIAPGWEESLSQRAYSGDGMDLSVAYGFDAGLIGELELQVQFSQVLNQNVRALGPMPDSALGLMAEPESQASIGFNWSRGNFSGSVSSHYTDGIMLNGQVHPAAWTTVDINFAWRTPWNASLSVGAQNLLGQDHSGTKLGIDAATPPELDSAFSRVPYVRYEQDL